MPTDVISSLWDMRSHIYPLVRRSAQASRVSSITKARLVRQVSPLLLLPLGLSASMQDDAARPSSCPPQLEEEAERPLSIWSSSRCFSSALQRAVASAAVASAQAASTAGLSPRRVKVPSLLACDTTWSSWDV